MIVFDLKNFKIKIHFSFFAIITILLIINEAQFALYGFYACILHEIGHLIVIFILNVDLKSIDFYGAGIRISLDKSKYISLGKELLILISGCIVNFILFFIFYFAFYGNSWLMLFGVINLLIGIFNLLPYKSLDGGRIISELLNYFLTDNVSRNIMQAIKYFSILLIISLLIYCFIERKGNLTLFYTLGYLLLASLLF